MNPAPMPSDEILDLLTAYALGALEPAEVANVQRLLEQQPELVPLLNDLQQTVAKLPAALPEVQLPAGLRERTLANAVGTKPPTTKPPWVNPLRRWIWVLSSSTVAALLLAALAFGQVWRLQNEVAQLRLDLVAEQTTNQQVAAALLDDRNLITLTGSAGRGRVVAGANNTTVMVAQLPPLAQGRVYQLWLIAGTNSPLSAGTFVVDEQGLGQLRLRGNLPAAVTFAITDEPSGGSPGPTTPVLLLGSSDQS